ncbi:SDR family oxidoreductase [Dactylosporangium darangshiense]|uniref:NAD(P)H-binding protein n=1 Tax=Dactylosporangium darangshiense TaxID=579108 RepID=A0ABP8DSW3_9ACTN
MAQTLRALVIGATGNVGRPAVELLAERGAEVRGLSRAVGDVRDPWVLARALDGVDAVLLIWPFQSAAGIGDIAAAIGGRPVAYVSSLAVRDDRPPAESGVWGEVEAALRRHGDAWTFLRASGFAANTRQWAADIRAGGTVRVPYPQAARSLIHERDIAAVAAHVLTARTPGHAGRAYALTGPAAITQAEQIRTLGSAAGRDVTVEAATHEEALAQASWAGDGAEEVLRHWASMAETPEPVTGEVERLTGAPARPFADWAEEHAAEFRGH